MRSQGISAAKSRQNGDVARVWCVMFRGGLSPARSGSATSCLDADHRPNEMREPMPVSRRRSPWSLQRQHDKHRRVARHDDRCDFGWGQCGTGGATADNRYIHVTSASCSLVHPRDPVYVMCVSTRSITMTTSMATALTLRGILCSGSALAVAPSGPSSAPSCVQNIPVFVLLDS
jgi:hypothetical protein